MENEELVKELVKMFNLNERLEYLMGVHKIPSVKCPKTGKILKDVDIEIRVDPKLESLPDKDVIYNIYELCLYYYLKTDESYLLHHQCFSYDIRGNDVTTNDITNIKWFKDVNKSLRHEVKKAMLIKRKTNM